MGISASKVAMGAFLGVVLLVTIGASAAAMMVQQRNERADRLEAQLHRKIISIYQEPNWRHSRDWLLTAKAEMRAAVASAQASDPTLNESLLCSPLLKNPRYVACDALRFMNDPADPRKTLEMEHSIVLVMDVHLERQSAKRKIAAMDRIVEQRRQSVAADRVDPAAQP